MVFVAICYRGLEAASTYFLSPFYSLIVREQVDQDKKAFFVEKCCHTTSQILYFTVVVIWGYQVLSETDWLPYVMGGSLPIKVAVNNALTGLPFATVPPSIVNYCMLTMGYHFHDLVYHVLFKEKQTDYYEMLLHHIVTILLYFSMNFGGVMALGSVTALLHDLADIPIALCRLINSTIYFKKSVPLFLLLLVVWFWTRIFVFSQLIYLMVKFDFSEDCRVFMLINGVFLCILFCIHIFYFHLMFDLLFNKIVAKG